MMLTLAVTRVDPTINFQWGTSAITSNGVDYVSARWTGKLKAPSTGTYTLYVYADDGARVWVDKQLIIDTWTRCVIIADR